MHFCTLCLLNNLILCVTIIGGVDYGSGPYTVTFPAGVTSVSFDVPITDDNILEDDETFDLIISSTSLSSISIGIQNQTTVTIEMNDRKYYFACVLVWFRPPHI